MASRARSALARLIQREILRLGCLEIRWRGKEKAPAFDFEWAAMEPLPEDRRRVLLERLAEGQYNGIVRPTERQRTQAREAYEELCRRVQRDP